MGRELEQLSWKEQIRTLFSFCPFSWIPARLNPIFLACMTGALWAKRGERDISRGARHEREAQDEGKRKLKLRGKYRVRPARLIKRLSCRLQFSLTPLTQRTYK